MFVLNITYPMAEKTSSCRSGKHSSDDKESELFRTLKETGGTPHIRQEIFKLLDRLGIPHNRDVYTARAMFAVVGAQLENDEMPEIRTLFDLLQDVVSRKVRSIRSVEHLHSSSRSLMLEIGGEYTPDGPASSATIVRLEEDSVQQEDSAQQHDRTSILKKLVLILVLLVPVTLAMAFKNEPEKLEEPPQKKPLTTETSLEAYKKRVMKRRQDFDPPRRLHDPNLLIGPPTPLTDVPPTLSELTNRQTIVGRSPFMRSAGMEWPTIRQTECSDVHHDIQQCFSDHHHLLMDRMFQQGRVISEQANYKIISGISDQDQRVNDAQDEELKLHLDYLLEAIDPVYRPQLAQLLVSISRTLKEQGQPHHWANAGEYMPFYDHIWLRNLEALAPGESLSMDDRIDMLLTLIHEVGHRVHMAPDFIADWNNPVPEYSFGPLKTTFIPIRNQKRTGPSEEGDAVLSAAKDEVEAVLYLGYKSERMTYDEAVWLNRKILDMRLRRAYAKAMDSNEYQDSIWAGGYWSTNYYEFWAEASVSFLVENDHEKFPPRDWIEEHDPDLFSILREVWSRARYGSFDNVRPFPQVWGMADAPVPARWHVRPIHGIDSI